MFDGRWKRQGRFEPRTVETLRPGMLLLVGRAFTLNFSGYGDADESYPGQSRWIIDAEDHPDLTREQSGRWIPEEDIVFTDTPEAAAAARRNGTPVRSMPDGMTLANVYRQSPAKEPKSDAPEMEVPVVWEVLLEPEAVDIRCLYTFAVCESHGGMTFYKNCRPVPRGDCYAFNLLGAGVSIEMRP